VEARFKKLYDFMLANEELDSMFVGNWEEDKYLFINEQMELEALAEITEIDLDTDEDFE
jgi:hypothetical protein